jgi:hypothetical protein
MLMKKKENLYKSVRSPEGEKSWGGRNRTGAAEV